MAIYIPNKNQNNETTKTTSNSSTEMETGKLDIIISEIVRLKAQPQSAQRDALIQARTAERNALLSANASTWDSIS